MHVKDQLFGSWALHLSFVMILILCSSGYVPLVFINRTRKRFSEKLIVAFTNSTVFIKDLYMTNPVWSHGLALMISQSIPDCIRYIIGVFCYNFNSQTNILTPY